MRWFGVAAVVLVFTAGCARTIDGAATAPDTNPTETGVYDRHTRAVVSTTDNDWLKRLVGHR